MKDLMRYKDSELIFIFQYLIIAIDYLFTLIIYMFIFRKQWGIYTTKKDNMEFHIENETSMDIKMQRKVNSISLFGKFTLYDKAGRDITYMLSARLRNTFLLILEYSLIKEGIPSLQLNNILWSNKDKYSAKNLREVTIDQLRKTFYKLNRLEL